MQSLFHNYQNQTKTVLKNEICRAISLNKVLPHLICQCTKRNIQNYTSWQNGIIAGMKVRFNIQNSINSPYQEFKKEKNICFYELTQIIHQKGNTACKLEIDTDNSPKRKAQYALMIKSFCKLWIGWSFLNLVKILYKKFQKPKNQPINQTKKTKKQNKNTPTVNAISSERQDAFP